MKNKKLKRKMKLNYRQEINIFKSKDFENLNDQNKISKQDGKI